MGAPFPDLPRFLRHLGEGILEATAPIHDRELDIDGIRYRRFIDRLFLPALTCDLSPDQICIINRFRNQIIDRDPQFKYNRWVKRVFEEVILSIQPSLVLEIGPGCNPLTARGAVKGGDGYVGCDIDDDAVSALRAGGLSVCAPHDLRRKLQFKKPDVIVGCFSFQFRMEDDMLSDLERVSRSDSLLLFNVPTGHVDVLGAVRSRFTEMGYVLSLVKMQSYANVNDTFVVASRRAGTQQDALRKMRKTILRLLTHCGRTLLPAREILLPQGTGSA